MTESSPPKAVAVARREVDEARQQGLKIEHVIETMPILPIEQLAGLASERDGVRMLVEAVPVTGEKALLELVDKLKGKLGDAAVVLVAGGEGRVDLVASVSPSLVQRGVRAGEVVKSAAAAVGGGGGGRDTLARAGGRDVERVPEAIEAARQAIETALAASQ